MRSKPRPIVVDGRPMVALPAEEFENLLATRRQLGGQAAKLRILRDALVDMTEFLDLVAEELDGAATAEPREAPSACGPSRPRTALVTEIRRRAHQSRAITGGRPTSRSGPPANRSAT
ncbi:hypothetical protein ACWEQ8_19295 [Streptomyces noursei]